MSKNQLKVFVVGSASYYADFIKDRILVDDIKSRGLMIKRNRTASIISRETVLIFEKPT